MKRSRLSTSTPWTLLSTTAADWAQTPAELLSDMFAHLHLIRAFEEVVLELAAEGLVHGPAHSSIGQEAGAVGSVLALRDGDAINGSHRAHHQFLAKAIQHVAPSLTLGNVVTPAVAEVLQRTLAEILGLAQGYCRGRGGSMHLQWLEAGALGTNAIVGGGAPLAAGNAFAQRRAGTDNVTVTYFGDGATNIGSVLETMNLAGAWQLPLVMFIENNAYAVSTTVDESTAEPRLSSRGGAFGIPAWQVDGMDPLAVYLAMREADEVMRTGGGPVIIEALVYRYFHQNGPYPGSAFGYRSKDEEQHWRDRDPLLLLAAKLTERGIIDAEGVENVRAQAVDAMRAAVDALLEPDPQQPATRRIRPDLWPAVEFVDVGVRGDASELDALPRPTVDSPTSSQRFIDIVSTVMARRMEMDERIIVLGEDVHRLGGGTNGATKGLAARFPDRILGTPISENAFAGLAGGMAMDGRYRPVVEFMYPDFVWVAADQVFNQIAKSRHMFGGDHGVPLVLRSKVAMGSGYGSQHLMDPAGVFATSPGWRIVAPSSASDYVGLMNAALALDDPVLVIEHLDLYAQTHDVPDDLDFVLPPGTAAIRRVGSDVTVISYLSMVGVALEAIERDGIDAELVDLRWLDRASIDWDTIGASIQKTNAVLIVEQGAVGTSYGSWLADEIHRRFFDHLDQPVQRVTGGEASPSISRVLERAAIAGSAEVERALVEVRRNWGGA